MQMDNSLKKPIEKIELTLKESIWGYHGNKKCQFLKIIFSEIKALNAARHILYNLVLPFCLNQ
jgi:hypothetical protein